MYRLRETSSSAIYYEHWNKHINHQKLLSFKTSPGNYSQFLWHVSYVNDLEYLSVSEELNYNEQNISSSLIFFGLWAPVKLEVWPMGRGRVLLFQGSILICYPLRNISVTL